MKIKRNISKSVGLWICQTVVVALVSVGCGGGGGSSSTGDGPVAAPARAGISLLAGSVGGSGNLDGAAAAARFRSATAVTVDQSGNVYVADNESNTIRKITAQGIVTTLAGTAGVGGSADGTGAAARFNRPFGVAVDGSGNAYVADRSNHTIRKITAAGVVTTLAGAAGVAGSAEGTGAAARFTFPSGVAVDGAGNVYVADTNNNTIRKITAAGVVTTLAGTAGNSGSADGNGEVARFNAPVGVAVDKSGNVFVTDGLTVRKITATGVVTTLAGTAGVFGSVDGTGATASFNNLLGVGVDEAGNVYVGDSFNSTIRKITAAGVVTTLVEMSKYAGAIDQTATVSSFFNQRGMAVDGAGNVYVANGWSATVTKIAATGVVTTLAGTALVTGSADGTGAASFLYLGGVAVDGSGNAYVADTNNHTIRKITAAGVVTTLAGTAGVGGSVDGIGTLARFNLPKGVALDGAGNVYVADTNNNTIRKITAAGVVTTLAGAAGVFGSADGTGATANFGAPTGVAVDGSGNAYVVDTNNHTIRKITAAGVVTTLAGAAGVAGSADGTGAAARFTFPSGVAVDGAGNVYVADTYNNTIRKITAAGIVTTLAGAAEAHGSADGAGAAASFAFPKGVAVDGAGNVYVDDTENNAVRKITAAGVVTTVAGSSKSRGIALGDLPGSLAGGSGIALDAKGVLYITTFASVLKIQLPL